MAEEEIVVSVPRVSTEFAEFLASAFSMPIEHRAMLIAQYDDLDDRNSATFAAALVYYLHVYEDVSLEATNFETFMNTVNTEIMGRFLIAAVRLKFGLM